MLEVLHRVVEGKKRGGGGGVEQPTDDVCRSSIIYVSVLLI